jgi:hypothetical protein
MIHVSDETGHGNPAVVVVRVGLGRGILGQGAPSQAERGRTGGQAQRAQRTGPKKIAS